MTPPRVTWGLVALALALIVVVAGFVVAVTAANVLGIHDSWQDTFSVKLANDTGHVVSIGQCEDSSCAVIQTRVKLDPGVRTNVILVANNGEVWTVSDQSGHRIGCVVFNLPRRDAGKTIPISQVMGRCN